MWVISVVIYLPLIRFHVNLLKCIKNIRIQHIFSKCSVKSFDICVLCWFTWLDVLEVYVIVFTKLNKGFRYKFRTVICSNCIRFSSFMNKLLYRPDKLICRNRIISFINQRLSIVIINDVEYSKSASRA